MDDMSKESNVGDMENTAMKGFNVVFESGQNDEGNSDENSQNESDEGCNEEEYESTDEEGGLAGNGDGGMAIDGIHDFSNVIGKILTMEECMKYHFADREVAFKFYDWYVRRKGFLLVRTRLVRTKLKFLFDRYLFTLEKAFLRSSREDIRGNEDELTTSRCEGFHSQFKKFVHYKNNLTEFTHHLNRCLKYVRHREIEADFLRVNGDQPLETSYRELENSTSEMFTCDVFFIFSRILTKAAKLKVVGSKTSFSCTIYSMRKHVFDEQEWLVSFEPRNSHFKCSCRRMEFYGIPCDHTVVVMVYLDFNELPKSLVGARYVALLKACDDMCTVASLFGFGYDDIINKVLRQTDFLKTINKSGETCDAEGNDREGPMLKDPIRARPKGCSSRVTNVAGKTKGKRRCTTCRRQGHNRSTCPVQKRIVGIASENRANSSRCGDIGMSALNSDDESMEDDGSDNKF
ncbi:Zinc finger, PMZ-type [Sesbania bispinosa]|nr:Zinc finger, PMZ-type [Sesbania bispinosa]